MADQLTDKIRKSMVAAINDFNMIEDGDRILVAVSGGKDSTTMMLLLDEIRKRARIDFTLTPVMLNQKQPGFNPSVFVNWLSNMGISLSTIDEDTHSIVVSKVEKGKSFCGLCSRLRRGILYNYAHKFGFNKIALGHHRNDLNETVLLNMFYSGRIASMPPKLWSNDSRNIVIRPMCYVDEADIVTYAKNLAIPTVPCNLCGNQTDLKRKKIKKLLNQLSKEIEGIKGSLLTAQKNLRPSQLADRRYWDG